MIELLRPWKLFSLGIGLALLIVGSDIYSAPDWDIPICFIMAGFTYLTASTSLHILVERRWRLFPLMLLYTWFSVDGCYAIYWSIKDPQALAMMRSANFGASLCLYLTCGLIWYPRMSVREMRKILLQNIKKS
jgi:hypothetical protein